MNMTSEQVELIVQRVLEHLGTPADAAPSLSSASPTEPAAAAAARMAQIADHVVTQTLLEDALHGSKQVRIGASAILTPSARDFVRHSGIEIIREPTHAKSGTADRWQIIVTASTPQIAAATEELKCYGIACELRLLGLPAEAAAQAVSAVCRGEAKKVVVFTSQPEVVACLANRNDQIRAAAIGDTLGIERVQKSLNANVLVLDPFGKSLHELKAVFNAYKKS